MPNALAIRRRENRGPGGVGGQFVVRLHRGIPHDGRAGRFTPVRVRFHLCPLRRRSRLSGRRPAQRGSARQNDYLHVAHEGRRPCLCRGVVGRWLAFHGRMRAGRHSGPRLVQRGNRAGHDGADDWIQPGGRAGIPLSGRGDDLWLPSVPLCEGQDRRGACCGRGGTACTRCAGAD